MLVAVLIPCSSETLEAMLEGLVRLNAVLLARSQLPPLYRAGVRYRRERRTENWKNCEQIFAAGYGDCEDLCAWRAAELRMAGEIEAQVIVEKSGPRLWHVLVRRASGDIEDPSAILGMGSHA